MLKKVDEPELELDPSFETESRPFGRMTEAQYDAERAKLRETYGGSKKDAGVRWEQELATLFARSRWACGELAKKEERSKTRIVQL